MASTIQFKITSSNVKIALVIIFLALPATFTFGQQHKKQLSEKEKEELRAQREEATENKRQAFLQHHFNIQSKKTQKRMIENKKLTEKFYRKRYHKSIFQRLFAKKHTIKNKFKK